MASWSLLADFSFSDLLLFVPIRREEGEDDEEGIELEAVGLMPAATPPSPEVPAATPPSPEVPAATPPSPEVQAESPSSPEVQAEATGHGEEAMTGPEPGAPVAMASQPSETEDLNAFVVLGQIRPTTSQTLYEVDLVGQVQSAQKLQELVESYRSGVIVRAEQSSEVNDGLVRITHIPVRHRGRVIGVLCRVW
ncbi:MAG TPA: histidine kinase N-terminal domain-containing protein, partial [Acidimicrobiales bacterium]|nr:histidine kinase N-terminal domain-containing protein [Acidimicrobiales bacterium]